MPQCDGRLYLSEDRASLREAGLHTGRVRLTQFSRGFRLKAASVLVVLYALCVFAPAAAFAFGDAAKTAHCLTDENHGLGTSHVHSQAHGHDGILHQHADDGDEQQTTAGKCCGLFCLSALAPSAELPLAPLNFPTLVPSVSGSGILGNEPDRLYRPPDSFLSL